MPALQGHVEADETYIGGKYRTEKKGGGYAGHHKAVVFGIVERGGSVHAEVIPDTTRKSVDKVISRHVVWGSKFSTDEAGKFGSYVASPTTTAKSAISERNGGWASTIPTTSKASGVA